MATTERQEVVALAEELRTFLLGMNADAAGAASPGDLAFRSFMTRHLLLGERDQTWNSALDAAAENFNLSATSPRMLPTSSGS